MNEDWAVELLDKLLKEGEMSEERVPPELENFDEYDLPQVNAAEMSQTARHILRLARMSAIELKNQLEDRRTEIDRAIKDIEDAL
jgi:hypothetical protein